MTDTNTRSQNQAIDMQALIRARNSLIVVATREEARVEGYLMEAAESAQYVPRTWDIAQGVADKYGKIETIGSPDPGATLTAIMSRKGERGVWIMRDLGVLLNSPMMAPVVRQLRNFARKRLETSDAQTIILLQTSTEIPAELSGHAVIVDWPLPDRNEIAEILDESLEVLPEDKRGKAASNGARDAAIDAAVGLMGEEAEATFSKSLVQHGFIDPATVAKEKKRIVASIKGLEWIDPVPGGLSAVGGAEALKGWLNIRKSAFTVKAREYGLLPPKGMFVVGPPGTGKTLIAKCVATAWAWPLLRLDLNALKGALVGQSEGNIRQALKIIEAIGRCIVWIDEIEKALQGAITGSADGGVSADTLGTILSWMQERTTEAFVIATANDVEALPPELLRKGRFDEIFFVDLPNVMEGAAILDATLRNFGRSNLKLDLLSVSAACERDRCRFTGSEIAAMVSDALFAAFNDNAREITENDLLKAASTINPLSKTAAEKIEKVRKWAKANARPASSGEEIVETKRKSARVLDMRQ